jgi:hypothetical protein
VSREREFRAIASVNQRACHCSSQIEKEAPMRSRLLLALLVSEVVVLATGCDVDPDPDETDQATLGGPTVEFDPANAIIPFPNNLLIDPMTGRVNIPATNCETPSAEALRTNVLNQLDGFGTYETAISVTFTEPVDEASLMGRVLLLQSTSEGVPVSVASAMPISVVMAPSTVARFPTPESCESPTLVSSLVIVPTIPLEQKSTYTVALLAGITTATGEPFLPSATWALITQQQSPVTVENGVIVAERTPLNPVLPEDREALLALNQLWFSQQPQLVFLAELGIPRDQVLLAWQFTTQTVIDPLDPAVAGSPAASTQTPVNVLGAPIAVQSITCDFNATTCPRGINRTAAPYSACPQSDDNVQCFLKIALGRASAPAGSSLAVVYATGNATCETIGCAAVGDVVGGLISAKQYQTLRPNPLDANRPIPGPWTDPYNPTLIRDEQIEVLGFVPATPPPAAGHSVVAFGHGIGSSKEAAFAIAPQLAVQGFMTVTIDFVEHGSRAVRISNEATVGCDDASQPTPSTTPQCFAPFLSPDLATTRDGIRQSALDMLTLIADLKACGTTACDAAVPAFRVNAGSITYLGQSLGGIIGSLVVAVSPDVRASVLNTSGVGWLDILENTETLAIRCSLVNGLIEAGVLVGEVWTGGTTGLCLTDEWKTQPAFQQFAALSRWVLDPADPANFTPMLALERFLLQEVVGDQVIPNVTTERQAALTDTRAAEAACAPPIPPAIPPSPAIVTSPMTKKFLRYMNLPAGTCSARGTPEPFPGNAYEHSSLLRPAKGNCTMRTTVQCSVDAECPAGDTCNPLTVAAGRLGTARLQTDAITYLFLNK